MRPYSTDLRSRVVQAYVSGQGSQRQLAHVFGVSVGFVHGLLQRYRRTGSVEPQPHGGGNPGKITGHLELVRQLQQHEPDATLAELGERVAAHMQVQVSPSTLSRALARVGLPRKKNLSRRGARPARGRAGTPRISRPAGPAAARGRHCD